MLRKHHLIYTAILASQASMLQAENSFTEAIVGGKAYADFRLRYENVDQDNALKDADGLTLRSRLGYNTAAWNNLSATLEFEDSRVVGGVNDYNDTNGNNPEYSVIADPETTELDQAYLSYNYEWVNSKLGRQRIVYDNARFVGDVGWRQDRQTFDAFGLDLSPIENLTVSYDYVTKRNRIFAEEKDINSEDHLVNAQYKTNFGTIATYAYLLEEDNSGNTLDTYGARFSGGTPVGDFKVLYSIEYATQSSEAVADFDADYLLLEAGASFKNFTIKAGQETLGSDDGLYGFSTPLATLHAFNGWADQFLNTPAQGLVDTYGFISGPLLGGSWKIIYHDFEADESTAGVDDLGSEIDVAYVRKFAKRYTLGVKYAAYDAGDDAAGKVDTDKLWIWASAKF